MADLPPWDRGDAIEGRFLPKVRRGLDLLPRRIPRLGTAAGRRFLRRHPKAKRDDGEQPNDDSKETKP